MEKSERVVVHVPPQLRKQVQEILRQGYHKTRTEVIREALREGLKVLEEKYLGGGRGGQA